MERPLWAEQRPENWWDACVEAIRGVLADAGDLPLPNTSLDGAHDLARRLILTLRQLTFVYQGKEEQADSCAGISVVRDDENSPNPMLERLSGQGGPAGLVVERR